MKKKEDYWHNWGPPAKKINPAAIQLGYPEPSNHSPRLSLTPTVAKELALLAELTGWEALVPALLDMASRPRYDIDGDCIYSFLGSSELWEMVGGFQALNILQSEFTLFSQYQTSPDGPLGLLPTNSAPSISLLPVLCTQLCMHFVLICRQAGLLAGEFQTWLYCLPGVCETTAADLSIADHTCCTHIKTVCCEQQDKRA